MQNYQLRITLANIEPRIWRRIVVPGSVTLAKLHNIIQIAMGWGNDHLYLFTVVREQYGEGMGASTDFSESKVSNAKRVELQDVALRKGAKLLYEYDMGDGWEHQLVVEKIADGAPEAIRCLEGARACPPEDCGGPFGYAELLEIISDPEHPECEDRRAWLGEDFSPEDFDLAAVNRRLGRLKVRSTAA